MITFYYGPMGHGKSTAIFESIRADIQNHVGSFLIVPEQQTVLCERYFAKEFSPASQRLTEVLNFTRLANKVFRTYGGLKYNYLTKSGKTLLMLKVLQKVAPSLKEYRLQSGKEKGLTSLFLQTVEELKTYSVSPALLQEGVLKIEESSFSRRLDDILLVYSTYEKMLGDTYSDSYDDILALAETLRGKDYFHGKNVYIDGFFGFTKSQYNVILQLMQSAENVTICLECQSKDTDENELQFRRIVKTSKTLLAMAKRLKKEVKQIDFPVDYAHESKSLSYLCDNLWNFSAEPIANDGGISLFRAKNEFEECDYVASKICDLVQSGASYRDIAVILGNSVSYEGILDVSFDKYDIPYFFSKSSNILSKPVVKMLFSALKTVGEYRAEDLMTFLKCGYTDLTSEELGEFENYLTRWGLEGKKFKNDDYWSANVDGYVLDTTDEQKDALSRVRATRQKVISYLAKLENDFSSTATAKTYASALMDFFSSLHVLEKLEKEKEGETKEEAYELSQVWNNGILQTLDTLATICADEVMNRETFLTYLSFAFTDNTLKTIPTGDDKVIIGDAHSLRTSSISYVFLLGVNEGSFPAQIQNNSIFNDTDRITLESVGIELSYLDDVRADDELFYFRNGLSCASKHAFVSSLLSGIKGEGKKPSFAFERLCTLLNTEADKTENVSKTDRGFFVKNEKTAKEYYPLLHPADQEKIRRLFPTVSFEYQSFQNEKASLSSDTAKALFGKHIDFSSSKLDTFIDCKFRFYCSHVLKIQKTDEISFSSAQIGTFVHKIFEVFIKKNQEALKSASTFSDDEIERSLAQIMEEYEKPYLALGGVSKRLHHVFERLKKNIGVYVKNIVKEFSLSDFRSEYFELYFHSGKDAEPLKFHVGDATTLSLNGVCDRVDVFRQGDTTYIKIVDYKTGKKRVSQSNFEHGKDLQMLIYLFSLCKMESCRLEKELKKGTGKIVPAAVVYMPLNINDTKEDEKEAYFDIGTASLPDAEENRIEQKIKRNGLFLNEPDVLSALEHSDNGAFLGMNGKNVKKSREEFDALYEQLQSKVTEIGNEILSGKADPSPFPKTCEYCEYYMICRKKEES